MRRISEITVEQTILLSRLIFLRNKNVLIKLKIKRIFVDSACVAINSNFKEAMIKSRNLSRLI